MRFELCLALLVAAPQAIAAKPEKPSIKVHAVHAVYPAEARAAGHQGATKISVTVMIDGSVSNAVVTESSRSELLDRAAMDAMKQWRFEWPKDSAVKPKEFPFSRIFPFYKLSFRKSVDEPVPDNFLCRDFVADVDWYDAQFPGEAREGLRDYQIFLLPSLMAATQGTMEAVLASARYNKAIKASLAATLDRCRQTPDVAFQGVLDVALAEQKVAQPN